MATLGSIRAAIFPAAVSAKPLTPSELEREVSWARVLPARTARADALDVGELAILAGADLAAAIQDDAAAEELAGNLATARIAAVLLCGDQPGEALDGPVALAIDAVAAAAEREDLVAFRLVPGDAHALERSAIAFLVNQRAEMDRRAAELDGQLTRLALSGGGLSTLAAAIGEFVGRAVAIENPGGDALEVYAPSQPLSAAAAAARYLSRTLGSVAALRVVIPATPGERGSGGRLLLLGDEPANEVERVVAERAAGVLGLELARAAAADQAREELRRGEPLPADGPPWIVLMARQPRRDRDGGPDDGADRERIRAGVRAIAPARRLLLRGSAESVELRMVAAAPADDPAGATLAKDIAAYLGQTVAVSRPFPDAGGRPAAEAAARTTLEAAEALSEPPPVAYATRLPAYLLLGNLHNIPYGSRQATALLAPLLEGRRSSRKQRLETLRALLDAGGPGEAAASLQVHRNTIAYRIDAIERETGWDLQDPELRLALQIAIRIIGGGPLR
jgi:hypothetical protein